MILGGVGRQGGGRREGKEEGGGVGRLRGGKGTGFSFFFLGGEGGGGPGGDFEKGVRGKKWGMVGARETFLRWYSWLQG